MHILYIHQYFATPHGGTGTRSYEFARRWVRAGHRVRVVTTTAQLTAADLAASHGRRWIRRLQVEGIEVTAFHIAYRQKMGFVRRLGAFLSFMIASMAYAVLIRGVDVVYATSTPLTVGVPALAARWLRRRPYVFEVRDVWPEIPIALGILRHPILIWAAQTLERTIYRWASAIIPLSPGMAHSVRKNAPPGTEIVTIPNACDSHVFAPGNDGAEVRRTYGWRDQLVLVHTGAMGPANGLDSILHAANHFRDDPSLLFALIGEGGEKARLRAECERRNLSNLQIRPAVPKSEIPSLLVAADLGMATMAPVPVLEHNSANKFFDYLAAGKPILLNYGGWQRELLEDADAGMGCTMGDDEEFIRKIGELRADPERLKRMGENARRLAVERFDRNRLAAKALQVVVNAASRDRRVRR